MHQYSLPTYIANLVVAISKLSQPWAPAPAMLGCSSQIPPFSCLGSQYQHTAPNSRKQALEDSRVSSLNTGFQNIPGTTDRKLPEMTSHQAGQEPPQAQPCSSLHWSAHVHMLNELQILQTEQPAFALFGFSPITSAPQRVEVPFMWGQQMGMQEKHLTVSWCIQRAGSL